jgi:hypothetical protein
VRDVRTIKKLLGGAEAQARQAGEILPGAEHLQRADRAALAAAAHEETNNGRP